ncbi:nitrate- and nitrite sensing domain-containing protein [Micromonospora sp. WMMD1082]|uniref:sensor histidine kinase n=1 Tax=Micromonospora sp. WMMD1082 TaxID=3016104 RepID=UPI002417077C|nr:nitrate- and nitrite sensing domain-containing protein [Micromonospora sp. WMMD1082]MDG4794528.1 nitrate- and nitrite sensing domain-containing protein [Micromonospora sp. WMMD1082]
MRSRSANLRTKVIALLASLVALWAFAAWVTLRDGVNLLGVQAIDSQIVSPSEPLLLDLQVERRLAVAYLGGPNAERRDALDTARRAVDENAAAFRSTAHSWLGRLAADREAEERIDEALAELDELAAVRESIDSRSVDRASTIRTYSTVIESLFEIYDVVGSLDDPEIQQDTRNLIELYRLRELISQEDALLSGVLVAGRMTLDEQAQFTELVISQRYLASRTRLNESDQADFDQVTNGAAFTSLRQLEDRVISSRESARPAVTATEWSEASDAALTHLQEMVLGSGDNLVQRALPVAVGVILRLVLAAGLGLLAVITSIIVSITTARALVAQLQRLRDAAHKLSDERLPAVVERLQRGEKVDVATEAPPLDFGSDEIGQVGQAFNAVQETAIRTAVEQAELRRNVRDVFLSLARRTQALVHRQVTLLDEMERRQEDADELEDLFRVDHLATRMRRNAENLIVLSGATPGRGWRRNVPMVDVARAAVQEVEDYTRVKVLPFGSVALAGRAAGDIIHLLAELIENSLTFSPKSTPVEVRGQLVANGFAIEIEDRGLGMDEDDLAATNEHLASATEFNLANANKLGHFVVSRLAAKHQVTVRLKPSPYGGTTAVVLIPKDLVTTAEPMTTPAHRTGGGPSGSTGVIGDGPRVAAIQQAPVAVAEPPPVHHDTMELPAVDPPLRAAADAAATYVEGPPPSEPPAVAQRPAPPVAHTEHGLPMRVRQASIARQLRDAPPAQTPPADGDEEGRSPDEVRKMMSSYRSGTLRGRDDAARLLDMDDEEQGTAADDTSATETDR